MDDLFSFRFPGEVFKRQAIRDCLDSMGSIDSPMWRIPDLNRWPSACHADALPTELNPQGDGLKRFVLTHWRSVYAVINRTVIGSVFQSPLPVTWPLMSRTFLLLLMGAVTALSTPTASPPSHYEDSLPQTVQRNTCGSFFAVLFITRFLLPCLLS